MTRTASTTYPILDLGFAAAHRAIVSRPRPLPTLTADELLAEIAAILARG